jgi:hypothetical protein
MGIFQSRPEEPDEWAGLPAEPWEPRVPGEVLPPVSDDLGVLGTAGISFSVPTEILAAEVETTAEVGVDADGDGD